MNKTINIVEENQKNISGDLDKLVSKEMVFRKLRKDTIGRSPTHPTWG